MKNILVCCTVLFITAAQRCFAQTPRQVKHLAALAEVWGFLKYYHPSAAKGRPDWDRELIRLIPRVKAASSDQEFNLLMLNWYNTLPTARLAVRPTQPEGDSITRTFTDKDIEQFTIAGALKKQLLSLYRFHIPDSSRYITDRYQQYALDYILNTEGPSENPAYPSEENRLLSLFRYWNVISYFYPHKALVPQPWSTVLTRYIPGFIQAKDSAGYCTAVQMLIHELPDSHSFYQNTGWNKRYGFLMPFKIYYVEGRYVIGECDEMIAKGYDYRIGDEIVETDGTAVAQREKDLLKIVTGTNKQSLHRNIANELLRGGDSVVFVTFRRAGKFIKKPVELHTYAFFSSLKPEPRGRLWEPLGSGIWHVRFCDITSADTLHRLFTDIHDAKAVIWDMRGYPNFLVSQEMEKGFFTQAIVSAYNMNANVHFPGSFTTHTIMSEHLNDHTFPVYSGALIVLVNEQTQSLSESVAALLRLRRNTLIMGRQTAGTTGNITWLNLPGGLEVSYTGVGVTGANGSFTQQKGVAIDKVIDLSVDKLQSCKDYILQEAVHEAQKSAVQASASPPVSDLKQH